ncbi:hypothetical protein PIB30_025762 [Stylosanthes scabra]|uniref:Uncharacterized protein n=1 Tax=Stylosanthes scabra TaxID=79078 RepID=A0ABU6RAJ2_9FABA|nr:hypothetical protein [Stylosanthes scabra]
MANLPSVRPWSRLGSVSPTPSKPSTPQSQPSKPQTSAPRFRFTALGAAGRTSSAPSSPLPSTPNSNSLPNSPSPKPSQSPKNSTTENNAYANSTESKQGTTPSVQSYLKVNTEVQPTKIALESNPKETMLVQRESGEKQIETTAAKEKGIFHNKKLLDSENNGSIRVITISGENRGAYMEIIQSSSKKKPNFLRQKNGNSDINKAHDETTKSESSENYSADRKNKNKNNHRERTTKYYPNSARISSACYINSNVQNVNNSLLYGSSCSCNDPGVQLTLSARKPYIEAFHQTEDVHGKNKNN